MLFTNNIVVIMILFFFLLYFTIFNERIFKFNLKFANARVYFIAIYSVLFYTFWYPPAILLLFYYAFISNLAKKFGIFERERESKRWLFGLIVSALLPLLFFKYFNYFLDVFEIKSEFQFILPLGISFYAFSVIGYFVDVFKQKTKAFDDYLECLLFVAFWPHLASGPILRAKNIYENILHKENLNLQNITTAVVLICSGLIKKLLIADNIGAYVNWNFGYGVVNMNALEAWASIIGFGVQIYADFSGYSDMAIGFALLMGFKLPANFNYPYVATSVTEFWRRWHISLSSWFRDYVYFPLGGSKNGKFHTCKNIFIVFVLSGIWHGAGLGFIIWGALHGAFLVIEKLFFKSYMRVFAPLRWVITFVLVMVAWSYFRLEFSEANILVAKLFGFLQKPFSLTSPYYVLVIFAMILFVVVEHILKFYKVGENGEIVLNDKIYAVVALCVLLFLALNFSGEPLSFIYFEF